MRVKGLIERSYKVEQVTGNWSAKALRKERKQPAVNGFVLFFSWALLVISGPGIRALLGFIVFLIWDLAAFVFVEEDVWVGREINGQ